MKKVIAVFAVVAVVFTAGTALAQQKNNRMPVMPGQHIDQRQPQQMPPQPGTRHQRRSCCAPQKMGRGFGLAPDMPQDIREKATELAKLRIDLHEALTSKPINKAKALDVHAQMQKLENELDSWRFTQKIEHIEAMRKQMELNKNVPPAPAPKPAPEAEVKAD